MKRSELKEIVQSIVKKKLQEIGEIGANAIADTQASNDGLSDADKKSLVVYQSALDKMKNDIAKIDSDITKLHAPVQRKIEALERKKAVYSKKQGQIIDKISGIKGRG
jgi:flagellar motility protein MotE (MotC chaperone)